MDVLQEAKDISKMSLLSHVFSSTEEGKAEILNVVQYSLLGVVPVVVLNKLIQRFIPEADPDKSSIELLAEIVIQLIVIFCGLIFSHRLITYIPTYSGFKYENLTLTSVVLAFLVIVLSIQSKVGLKVNIIVDRLNELWNGEPKPPAKNENRTRYPVSQHAPSQADYLDNSAVQHDMFPPAPVASSHPPPRNDQHKEPMFTPGPMAANGVLGGAFGSAF
jgi:hypothetical protein